MTLRLLVVVLLVAGCAGATSPAATAISPTPSPSLTPTPPPTPTPSPTPAPTPNPRAAAIRALVGSIVDSTPPTATVKQVNASVSAAYAAAGSAEQVVPQVQLTSNIDTCGSTTGGLRNAERLMGCDSALVALVELNGATLEPGFATAAIELWGYMLEPSKLSSVREATIPYLKIVFATELGIRPTSISGTITDASGAPLAGIHVGAGALGMGGYGATTAADGTYTITGLMPNTYCVETSNALGYPSVRYSSKGWTVDFSKQTCVVVDSVPVIGIDIAMPSLTRVSGKVLDKTGAPFPGVEVTASYVSETAETSNSVATGADGTFSLGLIPGTWAFLFEPPNDTGGYFMTSTGVKPNTPQYTPKELKVGSTAITDYNIKLPIAK